MNVIFLYLMFLVNYWLNKRYFYIEWRKGFIGYIPVIIEVA